MPFAIILHSSISLYSFTCPDIFPTDFEMDPNGIYVIPKSLSLSDRLSSKIGISYTIVISLSLIGFGILLWKIKKYNEMRINKIFDQNQIFWNSRKNILSGDAEISLLTYDIMHNQKYSKLVSALNSAVKHKRGIRTLENNDNFHNELNDDQVKSLNSLVSNRTNLENIRMNIPHNSFESCE